MSAVLGYRSELRIGYRPPRLGVPDDDGGGGGSDDNGGDFSGDFGLSGFVASGLNLLANWLSGRLDHKPKKKKPDPLSKTWSDRELTAAYAEWFRWNDGFNPTPHGIGRHTWDTIIKFQSDHPNDDKWHQTLTRAIVSRGLEGFAQASYDQWLPGWTNRDLLSAYAQWFHWYDGHAVDLEPVGSHTWEEVQQLQSDHPENNPWGQSLALAIGSRFLDQQAQWTYDHWLPDWTNDELAAAYAEWFQWYDGRNAEPQGVGRHSWAEIQQLQSDHPDADRWGQSLASAVSARGLGKQAQSAYDHWQPRPATSPLQPDDGTPKPSTSAANDAGKRAPSPTTATTSSSGLSDGERVAVAGGLLVGGLIAWSRS